MTTPVPSLPRSRRPAAAPDAPWADRLAGPVFAGRDRELAELDGLLALAAAGAGQVALIEGEPGLGKSALPRALFDLERARCLARGRNRPAAPRPAARGAPGPGGVGRRSVRGRRAG